MSPAVEAGAGTEVDEVVLELGSDGPGQGACVIQRDGDDVAFAFDDGLCHGAFGSEVSGLAVGNESVSIAHEEQGAVEVDAVERGDFSGGVSLEQNHHEVIIDVEPSLHLRINVSPPWLLTPRHLNLLIFIGILLHRLLMVLQRASLWIFSLWKALIFK